MLKTYKQFSESYNSDNSENLYIRFRIRQPIVIFHEQLNTQTMNLKNYCMKFFNNSARELYLKIGYNYRGTAHIIKQKIDIFIWDDSYLHDYILTTLIEKNNINNRFYKQYNEIYDGNIKKNDFCFPFMFTRNQIYTNLSLSTINTLKQNHNFENIFQIDINEIATL